jgi:hypothetical protein
LRSAHSSAGIHSGCSYCRTDNPGFETLQWAGWICLWIAGVIGVQRIITLRRKGRVPKGCYVHTAHRMRKARLRSMQGAQVTGPSGPHA